MQTISKFPARRRRKVLMRRCWSKDLIPEQPQTTGGGRARRREEPPHIVHRCQVNHKRDQVGFRRLFLFPFLLARRVGRGGAWAAAGERSHRRRDAVSPDDTEEQVAGSLPRPHGAHRLPARNADTPSSRPVAETQPFANLFNLNQLPPRWGRGFSQCASLVQLPPQNGLD